MSMHLRFSIGSVICKAVIISAFWPYGIIRILEIKNKKIKLANLVMIQLFLCLSSIINHLS